MEATEVAILGLMQTYCECPVNNSKFHNSTASCSRGTVTFSSTLAHASDNGSVIATTLIETFEVALAKEDHPTITVDGQQLAVLMSADDDTSLVGADDDTSLVGADDDTSLVGADNDTSLVGTTGAFFAGFSAATLGSVVTFFTIIW